MRKLIAISGFVFLAACGGEKKGIEKVLNDMEGFKARVCKCTDKACVEKIKTEYDAWEEKMQKDMEGQKPTSEQDQKYDDIEDAMKECARKFEGAAPP